MTYLHNSIVFLDYLYRLFHHSDMCFNLQTELYNFLPYPSIDLQDRDFNKHTGCV